MRAPRFVRSAPPFIPLLGIISGFSNRVLLSPIFRFLVPRSSLLRAVATFGGHGLKLSFPCRTGLPRSGFASILLSRIRARSLRRPYLI